MGGPTPFFPMGKKWENTHFSMGKNGVVLPPPIDAWNHSKTAILKFCAPAVRGLARALIFDIAYYTLH